MSPPDAGIFPNPVSGHHQYLVAVFFVGATNILIFLLAIFGCVSVLLRSSFCMFLYSMMLLAQILVLIIFSTFAIVNRHKINEAISSQLRTRFNGNLSSECSETACSSHLQLLSHTEQILLLMISCCYCDYLSEREQFELIEKDNANSN